MKKCPRCELNYIADSDTLCKVCLREMKGGHKRDEIEPCSICNEAPALPGKDICLGCFKELYGNASSGEKHAASVDEELDRSNTDIIADIDDDMDQSTFDEDDDDELSLETMMEDDMPEDEDFDG